MIAVVSDHTELRRAGVTEYVGRCPFHDERTPSFGVNPIEKVYYCFGCQASGDVFTFVMETEGLDFPGALAVARRPVRRRAPDRGGGPRGGREAPAPPAAAVAARPGVHVLRPLPVGGAGGRARPRLSPEPWPARGHPQRVPRRLRPQRVGPDADRVSTRRVQRRGPHRHRARAALAEPSRADLRPVPRTDHVPLDRPPRQRDRLRRAGDARQPAAEVPEHRRGRALPQAGGAVRAGSRPGRRGPRSGT